MTTFPAGEQTHQAVLPQQPALESVGADNPGSRDETAHGQPATVRATGREHGRGETDERSTRPRRRHAAQAETGDGDVPTHGNTYKGGAGASRVFVLANDGRPLMPCHPARARELLAKGRAVVARQAPFTIRLKDRSRADSEVEGVRLRIDPGSKGTGITITDSKKEATQDGKTVTVRRGLVSVELQHRGQQIHKAMGQRAGYRHRRRAANCRYRRRRSNNRTHPQGWLAPSLRHRVDTTLSTAGRLCRYAPITEIHIERVAFDTHAMSAGKDLTAAEYRSGTLAGTEIREYLLAKWGRSCAYCGATGVPLNIDHVRPRSRGGSNRISNLVLACISCNQAKGATPVTEFLARRPDRLATILEQAKAPLHDAGVMNATRQQLAYALEALGRPVHVWSGGRTKWNRTAMGLNKSHTLDALCVGRLDHENGDTIVRVPQQVSVIKATGRGVYARTTPDRFGFPRLRRPRRKQHYGFATGDLVRATVPTGRWKGTWTGRVAVRATGQHSLTTPVGRLNVSHVNLRLLQRADGYSYAQKQEVIKIG
ncbi:RNA-guided endonuclease IscB [Streptomyces sp. NPDC023998]|uniref:RNA-guided endonuclease IscB n=1 Tax=Streptomyces sp. NPDC023998 TaxID=3154597 RepID=UPI0033FB7C44